MQRLCINARGDDQQQAALVIFACILPCLACGVPSASRFCISALCVGHACAVVRGCMQL